MYRKLRVCVPGPQISIVPVDSIIDVIKTSYLGHEKEQIQKAFADGQETPLNHPTLPHYSSEEYYNQKFT